MASTTLYPPIIDSYMPAFVASNGCTLYFSMSEYSSSISGVASTHVSIIKQSSGQSVVNKIDDSRFGRYRSTGIIIINAAPEPAPWMGDNVYYIELDNDDVTSGDSIGWQPGWIYKAQVRLSTVAYDGTIGQTAWLNANASNFSEWSTYCILKATDEPEITIPILENSPTLDLSILNITGDYYNSDQSELLYSYYLELYDDTDGIVVETTEELYTNQYASPNQFSYLFKTELKDQHEYVLYLNYKTINGLEDEVDFSFDIVQTQGNTTNVYVVVTEIIDNIDDEDFVNEFKSLTFMDQENDEARVGLKLYLNSLSYFQKWYMICRASSKDNFSTWTDIKLIECYNEQINNLPMIYDYTIESGVIYMYGVQEYDPDTGVRGVLNKTMVPVFRDFHYAYLLGEDGRQLKLQFNNNVSSYGYVYSEGMQTTLGGTYPFIMRNGNTKYRTFPISGLISFNMDDQETFTDLIDLYKNSELVNMYQAIKRHYGIGMYDYKLEHDFREKVIEFLQDGKPKLFKSASEGNIIIRLTGVTEQPNQSLDRMIYSFNAIATEQAEATMENYYKYKFYSIGNEGDGGKL